MSGIRTNDGGSIEYRNYKNGVGFALYVPPKVNADTPIFTYTYGSGQKEDWYSVYQSNGNYGIYDGLIENGSDSIVIMPYMGWDADWGGNTLDIINSIRQEYGITNLNVSGSGFSKGGFGGFVTVAENIRQNPNIDPQVVFFVDDYSNTYYQAKSMLDSNGRGELLAKNNTILFAYDPDWKSPSNYRAYIQAGLNMVRVEPQNSIHAAINANFFKNRIYDYMAGASLPQEGYVYKVYNREKGTWLEIDCSKIATIDKLYDYFDIDTLKSKIYKLSSLSEYEIKSDGGVVEQYLNNIIGTIKSSGFLNSPIAEFGGSSTTSVPSQIPGCVRKYFISTAKTIERLVGLMDAISEIDPSYQSVDQNLLSMMKAQSVNVSSSLPPKEESFFSRFTFWE